MTRGPISRGDGCLKLTPALVWLLVRNLRDTSQAIYWLTKAPKLEQEALKLELEALGLEHKANHCAD